MRRSTSATPHPQPTRHGQSGGTRVVHEALQSDAQPSHRAVLILHEMDGCTIPDVAALRIGLSAAYSEAAARPRSLPQRGDAPSTPERSSMSSRDRDFDPMELLHQASTEDAVPEESARSRTDGSDEGAAGVGRRFGRSSVSRRGRRRRERRAGRGFYRGSHARAHRRRLRDRGYREFLHWSAPGAHHQRRRGGPPPGTCSLPAGSIVHAVLGTSNPRCCRSLAPAGSIAVGVPPAAVTTNLEVPAIVPPAGDRFRHHEDRQSRQGIGAGARAARSSPCSNCGGRAGARARLCRTSPERRFLRERYRKSAKRSRSTRSWV